MDGVHEAIPGEHGIGNGMATNRANIVNVAGMFKPCQGMEFRKKMIERVLEEGMVKPWVPGKQCVLHGTRSMMKTMSWK